MLKWNSLTKIFITLIALMAIESPNLWAATQSSKASTQKRPLQKIGLSYAGDLSGPSVENIQANDADVGLYNSIKASYEITPKTKVFVNPRAQANFISNKYTLLNPRIGGIQSGIIKKKHFELTFVDFTAEIPISQNGMIIAPGSNQLVQIPLGKKNPLSFGSFSGARYFFLSQNDPASPKSDLTIGVAPFGKFSFSEKASLYTYYIVEAAHPQSQSFGATKLATLVKPQFSYDVLPKLNIAPYLGLMPNNELSLNKTSAGIEISGAFF